jgi:uncharacterized protein
VPKLRPITESDFDDVLGLNERNVELLAPLDADGLRKLIEVAHRADVVDDDGLFSGFVVTIASGAAYDSDKYTWFSQRYDRFLYLDRIVLHEDTRRRGLGTFVYDTVEGEAAAFGRLLLEVNIEPPNEPSLTFHRRRGFVDVGRTGEIGHITTMMEKPL